MDFSEGEQADSSINVEITTINIVFCLIWIVIAGMESHTNISRIAERDPVLCSNQVQMK